MDIVQVREWLHRMRWDGTSVLALLLLLAYGSYAYAAQSSLINSTSLLKLPVPPLDNAVLDSQRGGFLDVEGFKVSIGLEKVLVVDGVMVARSRLVIPDINPRATVDAMIGQAMGDLDVAMSNLDEALGRAGIEVTEVRDVQPQPLQIQSNAETGIRTDTATLSQVEMVQSSEQVPVAMPVVGAAADVNAPIASTNFSMNDTATLVQNSVDNRLIQTLQVVNIELSNISRQTARSSIRSRLLPQIIHSTR